MSDDAVGRGDKAVLAERFRMAYAEAGYPDAVMVADECPGIPGVVPESIDFDKRAAWQAQRVVIGEGSVSCFDCWSKAVDLPLVMPIDHLADVPSLHRCDHMGDAGAQRSSREQVGQ